jgi:hypothetical protein
MLAAGNDLTNANQHSGSKRLIKLALCVLITLPAWVCTAYISESTTSPTLPAPLVPHTKDEWQALQRGATLVDVRKMPSGNFSVRGTALIKGTRRDLAWCLFRHGEFFAQWLPGIVKSQLLHTTTQNQTVQITGNFLFVSATMTYLRSFKPFSAVTWHLLQGDAHVDDGAWLFGPVLSMPPELVMRDARLTAFFLVHYVSVSRPNIPIPTFVLRAAKNRLLPRQIEALRHQLAQLAIRNPVPITPSAAPCPASLL